MTVRHSSPFVLSMYDRDFAPQDWITAPVEVHASHGFNEAGTLTVTLDADDDAVDVLTQPGARITCDYRHDPLDPQATMFVISGSVVEVTGDATRTKRRTFEVLDDFEVLRDLLGWPNPTGTIDQQGDDGAYYTIRGPAETVVKTLVGVNAAREGLPLTVAPDLGRGPVIEVSVRMHPILDRLAPALDGTGIGVTVQQVGASLLLDCYERADAPHELSQSSGVVVAGEFTLGAPTATRAVVMGQGEGEARVMVQVIDRDLETEWGPRWRRSIAVDARNNDADMDAIAAGDTAALAAYRANLEADGWAALAEHHPKASVAATLAETDEFRYGVTLDRGTPVVVHLDDAPPIPERVRSAEFDFTADGGLTVTPIVGHRTDDPDAALFDAVGNLARSQRDQLVRR